MRVLKLCLTILIVIMGTKNSFSQNSEPAICMEPMDPDLAAQEMDLSQLGGLYLTANGNIRVLVVYVSFRDDTSPNNHWPVGSPPPQLYEIIDPDISTGSNNYDNLTNYFNVMSLGQYQFVGNAIFVETPHDMSYYGNPPNRALATEDVLVNAVDPIVDFSMYDNWTRVSNYNHINEPDGIVDMIIMVWRGLPFSQYWTGEASLGGGSDLILDGTRIRRGYYRGEGSGLTAQFWGSRSENYNFKTILHELGHWLISGAHPYGPGNPPYSFWGILTHGFDGDCANAFERERLGWIDVTDITENVTANIADYVTTGEAYKYHPANGEPNEFYYFTNHQKLHATSDGKSYDDVTVNSTDKGIFVLHQKDIYRGQNNILCDVAAGNWNWENPLFTTNCYNTLLPAFRMASVNNNGTNHRAKQQDSQSDWEWVYALADENNFVSCGDFRRGDQFDDSFNPTITPVFSPWSNPNTNTWNNLFTDFAMEVLNQSGNVVNVYFYVGNAIDAPPARIIDLHVQNSSNNHPMLTWTASSEPDLGEYRIYKNRDGSGWFLLGTTDDMPLYEDVTETVNGFSTPITVEYKVTAVDNTEKESAYSNVASIEVQGKLSKGGNNNGEIPTLPGQFAVYPNYPNPFNPQTTIRFFLPEQESVKISVYNAQGSQVGSILNDRLDAGYHEIPFEAAQLPSGVYFYKIQAGSHRAVKKMMILK